MLQYCLSYCHHQKIVVGYCILYDSEVLPYPHNIQDTKPTNSHTYIIIGMTNQQAFSALSSLCKKIGSFLNRAQ